ncbi:hypothetical protein K457DRAFT_309852 [Linnemannia elongata AG-77]|uniref:F-box domain-containing protein n=1 Tax=Linnemannia elongata AG-77 TaxID=1314771 RepID=A0A197K6X9_9FUNG|nr:hypothetical protein K457DRAFT_309852 [Linnemannia elongata AG-77]
MATFLDLPNELRLPIAKDLIPKTLLSLILTCHSFHTTYLPCLWSDISAAISFKVKPISLEHIRKHAHLIQTIRLHATLPGGYYGVLFPRLRSVQLDSHFLLEHLVTKKEGHVKVEEKIKFLRTHSMIGVRKLVVNHKSGLPREFWEVVEGGWEGLDTLGVSRVVVEEGAVESFWRVCDRIQSLHLTGVSLPESNPFGTVLSTLSFKRLKNLTMSRYMTQSKEFHKAWPQEMLEQAKRGAEGLRRIYWDVADVGFPVRMILDAFAEGCWPELCELSIGDAMTCPDGNMAQIIRSLPSKRLTFFEAMNDAFGPLTNTCLKEMYFGHLTNLAFGDSSGCTSVMVQEVLAECVNLAELDAPYIIVRDIAKATKPWGCRGLYKLVVYIAKADGEEAEAEAEEWEGKVFEQIGRMRGLQVLDLSRDPYSFGVLGRMSSFLNFDSLDLRIGNSIDNSNRSNGSHWGRGNDIRCWSSLTQMRIFSFDGDGQRLGMDEARWMVEHWRELKCISGAFNGVEGDECGLLDRLFLERDISFYYE